MLEVVVERKRLDKLLYRAAELALVAPFIWASYVGHGGGEKGLDLREAGLGFFYDVRGDWGGNFSDPLKGEDDLLA